MKHLLVVDDDPTAVDALRTLLEMDGYQVDGFTVPAAAVALLRRDPVDLVITDLEMPGVHGTDVVRAAHAAGTPVLIVTAYAHSPAAASAVALGACAVMPKPVDYGKLLVAITKALDG
ncbi:MAG TPA: response regulator [Kofleriaceae bacterium]|nr:response regulator [Kofleriaceae bacterium]